MAKRDSLGDGGQIGEHDERIVKRVPLGIRAGQWWRPIGVYSSEHVVVGEDVVKAQVLDRSSRTADCDRISSKLDLGVCNTNLHGQQLSIGCFTIPRAGRHPSGWPRTSEVGCG